MTAPTVTSAPSAESIGPDPHDQPTGAGHPDTPAAESGCRRTTPRGGAEQAASISAQLAANEPVTVEIAGHGKGWWVVEVGDGTYTVMRDGSTLTVAWADVPLGG